MKIASARDSVVHRESNKSLRKELWLLVFPSEWCHKLRVSKVFNGELFINNYV